MHISYDSIFQKIFLQCTLIEMSSCYTTGSFQIHHNSQRNILCTQTLPQTLLENTFGAGIQQVLYHLVQDEFPHNYHKTLFLKLHFMVNLSIWLPFLVWLHTYEWGKPTWLLNSTMTYHNSVHHCDHHSQTAHHKPDWTKLSSSHGHNQSALHSKVRRDTFNKYR